MKQERFNELQRELREHAFAPASVSAEAQALAASYLGKPLCEISTLVAAWHVIALELGERRWAYLVRAASGPVKIGVGSNPRARLSSLQVGSPEPLELVACLPGGRVTEGFLHQMLSVEHVRGEWFNGPKTSALLVKLAAVAAQTEAA